MEETVKKLRKLTWIIIFVIAILVVILTFLIITAL